jgi:putative SOS response-associated peptidase YedK
MCGNFSQKSKASIIAKKHGIDKDILVEPVDDVYPWDDAYVIGRGKERAGLTQMKWSLIPSWFSGSLVDAKKKFKFNFNAIGEELMDKASYRDPYKNGQRCLIYTERFQEPFGNIKNAYNFFHKEKEDLMSIAALWNKWVDRESNERFFTFTMITSKANALVSEVHKKERMPLVLDEEGSSIWMNPQSSIQACDALIKPYSEELLVREKAVA